MARTLNYMTAGDEFDGNRTQRFGIEIEVEHSIDWEWCMGDTAWTRHGDGSLRNDGSEFVSRPLLYTEVPYAVDRYYREHRRLGYATSARTGIHVHADMRWRTAPQLQALVALYAAIEPALFWWVGAGRDQCSYSVPWYAAPDDLELVASLPWDRSAGTYTWQDWRHSLAGDTCKYSAFYLEPLTRYGTVEFRHAPTFEEAETLVQWVNIIHRMLRLADYKGSPEAVLALLDAQLQDVLNWVFSHPSVPLDPLMEQGSVELANSVVCTTRDWSHVFSRPADSVGTYYPTVMPGTIGGHQIEPLYSLDEEIQFEEEF